MKHSFFVLRLAALLLAVCLLFTGIPVSADANTAGGSANIFVGQFANYKPDPQYVASLRNKYPEGQALYHDGKMTIYVSELLTLYLAKLEEEGYSFGVMERLDMCSQDAYVVELTENGKSVIQIAFTISSHDPKYAQIMTLGCATDDYRDLDSLNRYIAAMWMAYDTLNIHMTPEKHASLMDQSEYTTSDVYGPILRGQYDGLGYVFVSGDSIYLSISPDLTLPVFAGMQIHEPALRSPAAGLKEGSTFFFGSYEQDNNATNGAEAIQWIVLEVKEDRVLAVSAQALDSRRFNNYSNSSDWRNCSLRTWLNKDFYNAAFTDAEKALLCPTEVAIRAGNDNVFLLNREEVEFYFPNDYQRLCKPTAYAIARKAYVNKKTGCCWWLLRTAGTVKGNVMSVDSDGAMDYAGGKLTSDRGTVRPAIWISTGN